VCTSLGLLNFGWFEGPFCCVFLQRSYYLVCLSCDSPSPGFWCPSERPTNCSFVACSRHYGCCCCLSPSTWMKFPATALNNHNNRYFFLRTQCFAFRRPSFLREGFILQSSRLGVSQWSVQGGQTAIRVCSVSLRNIIRTKAKTCAISGGWPGGKNPSAEQMSKWKLKTAIKTDFQTVEVLRS